VEILSSVTESSREVTGMALIDRALEAAKVRPEDIHSIILGLGPGSYTGVRSAIAIAQGWQLGRGVKTFGLSSIDCLGAVAQGSGLRGEISFIVDAQRGDVYVETHRITEDERAVISELKIIPRGALPKDAKIAGPEASKIIPGAVDLNPSASALASLIHMTSDQPAEELTPIYLREASFVKAPEPRRIE
jgi:tRNA threonylcarbamoyl adenosine modification protein YeaZ